MNLIIGFLLVLGLAGVPLQQLSAPVVTEESTELKTVEGNLLNVTLDPALIPVCACESTGNVNGTPKHYGPDGEVIRGVVNSRDIGMCQINLDYHEATASKMGLNLFDENDNKTYANYLYKTQGLTPWNWSKKCWSKHVSVVEKK